jgi:HSP20 family protein
MTAHTLVPRALRHLRPAQRGLGWSGLDRLFDELWSGFAAFPEPAAPGVADFAPRVDVRETEKEIRVYAELPGLEEKDFEVTLEGDVLSIRGERKDEREDEREGFLQVESARGSFRRDLRLPFEADADAVQATYARGVLEIAIPKPEQAQPRSRTIPVTAA